MSVPDVFAGIESQVPDELANHLRSMPLVDHHVHGVFVETTDRQGFEDALNEGATTPVPSFVNMFESPLGVAIRRWCAPLLDLPALASAEDYWGRRSSLSPSELNRALLGASGVDTWVVDTGFASSSLSTPPRLAAEAGGTPYEILRLESTMEDLLRQGVDAADLPEALSSALAEVGPEIVGAKTIAAYRCGLDIDWSRPSDAQILAAAQAVVASGDLRVADPTLIAFAVHEAVARRLPLQVHIGYGDRDLDLRRSDPMFLLPLLRQRPDACLMLLHCYPFHRQAAYLAQAFDHVHFDVGLAINFLGSGSPRLIAQAMELAPFSKQLYSSDAFGLPELHVLGALLWRRGMGLTLGEWVIRGEWSVTDAIAAVDRIGRENAERVYRLG